MYIYIMLAVFIAVLFACALLNNIKIISIVNIISMFVLTVLALSMGRIVYIKGYAGYFNNAVYVDSLSQIQLFIITTVSLITSVYSHRYIISEYEEKKVSLRKAKIYFVLFSLFVFSMMFLSMSNNIMGMWIGLEATTLATAFLIGFTGSKLSLEAAWKYIIICSIGLAIGLIGIILFIYSMHMEISTSTLQWTYLLKNFETMDKGIVKVAFTFIFVGIGTKAGLAPMHTWLSDGHSEAPSPVSAMMSGILINLALYVIVRFYIVVRTINGLSNLSYLFIVFGCISLIISSFSILKQTNYKRLLAFSSVENIGIMSLGFGFGGPIGVFGALLHSMIHAYGKSLLFLVSGNILSAYKTKRIDQINYLIRTMPVNAVFLMVGILVITGTPPFASFFSEFKILQAGILRGHYIASAILVLSLLLVFAGFLIIFVKMIFCGESGEYRRFEKDRENIVPLFIVLGFIVFVSITYGNLLCNMLSRAASIVCG